MASLIDDEMINRIEESVCIGMEEAMLQQPFFIVSNEKLNKMYDQMIFKYFEAYPAINFMPDSTKVTLVKNEREQ